MDRKLINPAIVQDIADAIREKGGQTDPIVVNALGDAIRALPQGMGDNTTEVVEAISGEQPEGDIEIANAIAKGATDAAREHVWQGERATDEGRELRDGVAFLSAIKGKSIKVNQLKENGNFESLDTYTKDSRIDATIENGTLTLTGKASSDSYYRSKVSLIVGHKYLYFVRSWADFMPIDSSRRLFWFGDAYSNAKAWVSVVNTWQTLAGVVTCSSNQYNFFRLYCDSVGGVVKYRDLMLFDLTAMGWEDVTSPDDFAHRLGYADAASLPYIPYGEQIINSKPTEVVSRGRNLWDEEWEVGSLSADTGLPSSDDARHRTKNYIPIVGGSSIYFTTSVGGSSWYIIPFFYDKDYTYIGRNRNGAYSPLSSNSANYGNPYVAPANARYMKAVFSPSIVEEDKAKGMMFLYQSTKDTDGKYEPYVQPSVLPLPLSSILHEGQPLFPQGLCGIGDVRDEVDWAKGKAVARYYKVVLDGTQRIAVSNWRATEGAFAVLYDVSAMPMVKHAGSNALKPNIIASRINTISYNNAYNFMLGVFEVTSSWFYSLGLRLPSTLASTEAEFVAYLRSNPMEVIYELATPIEVTFDPAKAFYRVQNGGTEEAVMDGLSAPLVADIAYRDNMAYAEEAALLAFANERSGQNDADLGDAIRTLSE